VVHDVRLELQQERLVLRVVLGQLHVVAGEAWLPPCCPRRSW
jgi:hypothetical protein